MSEIYLDTTIERTFTVNGEGFNQKYRINEFKNPHPAVYFLVFYCNLTKFEAVKFDKWDCMPVNMKCILTGSKTKIYHFSIVENHQVQSYIIKYFNDEYELHFMQEFSILYQISLLCEDPEAYGLPRLLSVYKNCLLFPCYQNFRKIPVCALKDKLLSAVNILHALHIVHLDIKPDNILFSDKGAILNDFDCSTILIDGHQAEISSLCGTVGYMPYWFNYDQKVYSYTYQNDLWGLGLTISSFRSGSRELIKYENEKSYFDQAKKFFACLSHSDPEFDLFTGTYTFDQVLPFEIKPSYYRLNLSRTQFLEFFRQHELCILALGFLFYSQVQEDEVFNLAYTILYNRKTSFNQAYLLSRIKYIIFTAPQIPFFILLKKYRKNPTFFLPLIILGAKGFHSTKEIDWFENRFIHSKCLDEDEEIEKRYHQILEEYNLYASSTVEDIKNDSSSLRKRKKPIEDDYSD